MKMVYLFFGLVPNDEHIFVLSVNIFIAYLGPPMIIHIKLLYCLLKTTI